MKDTVEREYTGEEVKDKYFPSVDWDTLRDCIYGKLDELTDKNSLQMKTCTPKPMEMSRGDAYYVDFKEIRWKVYNLAFRLLGKTRYWKRIGNILWL